MPRCTNWSVVGVSFFAGLLGGSLANRLSSLTPVFAQQPPAVPKVLRTGRLEIVDMEGKVAATFEVLPSGYPRILLGDPVRNATSIVIQGVVVKNGSELVSVGPLAGTSGILGRLGVSLVSQNGSLFAGPKGLSLIDQEGQSRLSFTVPGNTNSTMFMIGAKGNNPRVLMGVGDDGAGYFGVLNGEGKTLWPVPLF